LYYFTYFFLLVQKNPIKHQNPKNPPGWVFKEKPGFFEPCHVLQTREKLVKNSCTISRTKGHLYTLVVGALCWLCCPFSRRWFDPALWPRSAGLSANLSQKANITKDRLPR